jgi:hypothetical protein
MASGRFISKTIAHSEQLGSVSLEADYLFGRIIPHLDVEGRMVGNPTLVFSTVCPLRPDLLRRMPDLLRELVGAGLLRWYEVDGKQIIAAPGFHRHQTGIRKDREAASRFPPPDSEEATDVLRSDAGPTPEQVPVKVSEVKARQGKAREEEPGASAALVPVEPVQGEWSHDPQASLPTQELMGAWIKHYEKRTGKRPPGSDIPKQGAVAARICEKHTAEEVVYAFLGIDHLFPYSKGEPWDMFDLEKKFSKAMAKAQDHPDIKRQREEAAFMEAIGHREAA